MQTLLTRLRWSSARPFLVGGVLFSVFLITAYQLVGTRLFKFIPITFLSMKQHNNDSVKNMTSQYVVSNMTSPNQYVVPNMTSRSQYVVPNVVHFIWFAENARMKFSFIDYVSVLSAYKIQKPTVIKLHCNFVPFGDWWDRLFRDVPITLVYRPRVDKIYGQTIGHAYHAADVAKIEIIIEEGGIYLDMDVIVLKSLDPLRVYDATLGKEKPPKFIAGIMIGKPNATFFRLMHESYRDDYRPNDWDYNCARVPYLIYQRNPTLLHIERRKLTTPDWMDRTDLWDRRIDWDDLYVIHLMTHNIDEHAISPQSVQRIDTTFGQIMRYIYYGSRKLIVRNKRTTLASQTTQELVSY